MDKNFQCSIECHASAIKKTKVLLVAPTGLSSININGTTLNSALGIPINKMNMLNLSSERKCILCNKYAELQAVIIDKVSMISNVRLMQVH